MSKKIRYSLWAILSLIMVFGVFGAASAQEERRPLRQRRGLHGEITAIEDGAIILDLQERSVQIITNDETRFHIIGQAEAALDDFSLGDTIVARGQRQEDDTLLAASILLQPAGDYVMGRIAAVYADGLLVNGRSDQQITINATPDALVAMRGQELTWDGSPAGRDALQEGLIIIAFGTSSADGSSLDAHTITSQRPRQQRPHALAGTIDSFSGDGFTMTTLRGEETAVIVTGTTRYRQPDVDNPGLDDFAAGDQVVVFGQPDEEGAVTARIVAAAPENRPAGHPAAGEIGAINGDEISLTTLRGNNLTVVTGPDTIFRIGRDNNASLDDFAAGDRIAVIGMRGQDEGTVEATRVMKRK